MLYQGGSEHVNEIGRVQSSDHGTDTVSSTPFPSVVAAGCDNVTFRLHKSKSTSPHKSTFADSTPRFNLKNSYKWPAPEEVIHSRSLNLDHNVMQRATNCGTATERRQGYCKNMITHSVDKLRTLPGVSTVVSNLLADYEARVEQEVIPGKTLTARLMFSR